MLKRVGNIASQNFQVLYLIALRAEVVANFEPKMQCYTSILYNILPPNFVTLLVSLCSSQLW